MPNFFVGKPNKLYHKKKISEASKGSIVFRQLVSKCNHNTPVYPVLPSLLMSTDDTTVFTFRGRMEKGEQWYLLSGKGADVDTSKQSVYSSSVGGMGHLNRMRVRLTFTMAGTWSLAPPFITVTGLSEKELLVETCPSGAMYIEIPGLCV